MMIPLLSSITIYPVKSMKGHHLNSARVENMGLVNDRRLMLVGQNGKFLTQREHARIALINPELAGDGLILSAPGMEMIKIPITLSGKRWAVEIWNSKEVQSIDQGDEIFKWLSEFLKMPAHLVKIDPEYKREIDHNFAIHPSNQVSFADGYPILVTAQSSLDDLNSKLEVPVPMDRFRPNIVVNGSEPFSEDSWKIIKIGEAEFALVKPCARCNVPGIDQETAISSKEPIRTLSRYRNFNHKVMFGVNIIPIKTGKITVGDTVEILEMN
ncbi:MAG: MOSC N-terminal beta barrel domain-containing protein [Chloroflexota bacterium]